MQRHADVVGESILFGLGVAGLVAFGRGVRRRWHPTFGSRRSRPWRRCLSYGLTTRREGVSSHQPSGSPPALSVVDSPFSRGTSSSRSARLCAPSCGLGEAWQGPVSETSAAARSPRRGRGCRVPAPAGRWFEGGPARSTLLLPGAGRSTRV
jgi:hypothetical protein